MIVDHYLIEPDKDQIKYVDIDQLLDTGDATILSWPVTGAEPLGLPTPAGAPVETVHVIPRTSRFLYHFRDNTNPHIDVFEIEAGQLRTIATWPTTSGSAVIQHKDTVITAAPSSAEVEVRSLDDFQIVQQLPLPKGLGTWGDVTTTILTSHNGLFSFLDVKTGNTRVHRLDDFALIPELDLPLNWRNAQADDGADGRYALLSDSGLRAPRIIVYDTVERRIAMDYTTPLGLVDQRVAAGHLVTVTERLGMTVDMIELKSGRLVKRWQPFAWIAWVVPLVLLLALLWLIAWLKVTADWSSYPIANILLITALFVTPALTHVLLFGNARVLFRLSMGYNCVVLLAIGFSLALYVVYGTHRVLLRTTPVWLLAAAVLGLTNLYVAENGKRGLEGLWGIVAASIRLQVVFSFVAVAVLGCMRVMGFGLSQPSHSAGKAEAHATIPLRDMFVLTASVAAFVAAAAPNRAYLVAPLELLGTVIACLLVSAPALLGLIALAPSSSIYGFMRTVALLLALALIAEITAHISLGHLHTQPWYYLLVFVRYFTFLFLVTFTYGSILRSAGYRWCKTKPDRAVAVP